MNMMVCFYFDSDVTETGASQPRVKNKVPVSLAQESPAHGLKYHVAADALMYYSVPPKKVSRGSTKPQNKEKEGIG